MPPTMSSATTAAPAAAPFHRCSLSFFAAHAASFSSFAPFLVLPTFLRFGFV
jgi:hypothetical protein